MAVLLPKVWYANFGDGSTTGYYAVGAWTAGAANAAGKLIRQNTTPAVGSERVFVCIISGASANPTEPTWVVTKGAKTVDNLATWMECTGQPAVNGDLTNTPLSSANRSGAQVLGNIITNNTLDHYFICTTAGTTGAGEPSYNTTTGATTADNTCTWTCIGAVGAFAIWNAPHARIGNNFGTGWSAAGDTIYVSAIHAETSSATTTINVNSTANSSTFTSIICVSNTPTVPPVAADVTTGATLSTTGTGAPLTINGGGFFQGIVFSCGTLASAQSFTLGATSGGWTSLKNCGLTLGGTGGQQLLIGASFSKNVLDNVVVTFNGANTSAIQFVGGHNVWRDTASALVKTGAAWPTTLFSGSGILAGDVFIENVDLSAFAGTAFIGSTPGALRMVLSDCKVPALAAFATTASLSGPRSTTLDLINCDSAGTTIQHSRWAWEGTQTLDTSATRVGGATDGTTKFSWKVVTSANSKWLIPFEALPIKIWNATTISSDVVVTIEGAYSGAALPNNDEVWLETVYFGTASSTLGSRATETKANVLSASTPLGASTADWGSNAPARVNSHTYSVGDLIGVASFGSVNRLFVCTGGGAASGSLPVAYASAVDGTSVTDGAATFRAVERFKLTVTLTSPRPQSPGYLTCYVKAALASATYWIDPYVTLT